MSSAEMMVVRRVGCEERACTSALCEQRQPSCPSGSMLATSGRVDDLRAARGQHSAQLCPKTTQPFPWQWPPAPPRLHPRWAEERESPGRSGADKLSVLPTMARSLLKAIQSLRPRTQLLHKAAKPLAWLLITPLRHGTSENT